MGGVDSKDLETSLSPEVTEVTDISEVVRGEQVEDSDSDSGSVRSQRMQPNRKGPKQKNLDSATDLLSEIAKLDNTSHDRASSSSKVQNGQSQVLQSRKQSAGQGDQMPRLAQNIRDEKDRAKNNFEEDVLHDSIPWAVKERNPDEWKYQLQVQKVDVLPCPVKKDHLITKDNFAVPQTCPLFAEIGVFLMRDTGCCVFASRFKDHGMGNSIEGFDFNKFKDANKKKLSPIKAIKTNMEPSITNNEGKFMKSSPRYTEGDDELISMIEQQY